MGLAASGFFLPAEVWESGVSYKPFYYRWRAMRSRCMSKACPEYVRYGGRGIFVCEEWQDFKVFQDWCYETFEEGKSIDRIDNDGPYAPWNCRWATPSEQQANVRDKRAPGRLAGLVLAREVKTRAALASADLPTKTCSLCLQDLPRAAFAKRSERPCGLQSRCRKCFNASYR